MRGRSVWPCGNEEEGGGRKTGVRKGNRMLQRTSPGFYNRLVGPQEPCLNPRTSSSRLPSLTLVVSSTPVFPHLHFPNASESCGGKSARLRGEATGESGRQAAISAAAPPHNSRRVNVTSHVPVVESTAFDTLASSHQCRMKGYLIYTRDELYNDCMVHHCIACESITCILARLLMYVGLI